MLDVGDDVVMSEADVADVGAVADVVASAALIVDDGGGVWMGNAICPLPRGSLSERDPGNTTSKRRESSLGVIPRSAEASAPLTADCCCYTNLPRASPGARASQELPKNICADWQGSGREA